MCDDVKLSKDIGTTPSGAAAMLLPQLCVQQTSSCKELVFKPSEISQDVEALNTAW